MLKNIIKFVNLKIIAVIVLSVISAGYLSSFYINNFVDSTVIITASDDEIRDDISKLLLRVAGKKVTELTACENFVLAEHYLNQKTHIQKISTGTVTAVSVEQGMYARRVRSGEDYFAEEISSGLVPLAVRQYYTNGVDNIDYHLGTDIQSTTATWNSQPDQSLTVENFKTTFGIIPTDYINYIVSSKTITNQSEVNKLENGNYSFNLELETLFSVKNYAIKIKQSAGSSKNPRFKKISLNVEIDESWNLIQIKVSESYEVSIPALGSIFVLTDVNITDTFSYDESIIVPLC